MSLTFDLGLQYNFVSRRTLPIGYGISHFNEVDNSSTELFRFEIDQNEEKTQHWGLKGNVNLNYRLSKRHIIYGGLTFHYSPDHFAEVKYSFFNIPWESYGTAKLGMNYIGLQIGYGYLF